jgi:hypothetical protein
MTTNFLNEMFKWTRFAPVADVGDGLYIIIIRLFRLERTVVWIFLERLQGGSSNNDHCAHSALAGYTILSLF